MHKPVESVHNITSSEQKNARLSLISFTDSGFTITGLLHLFMVLYAFVSTLVNSKSNCEELTAHP